MGWTDLGKKIEIKLPTPQEGDDRHMKMLEAIAPYARTAVPSNVTTVEIEPSTKNTSIAFILLPEWSSMFAPFNIARLSSIALKAGYSTKCFDFNVDLFNFVHKELIPSGILDFDPWDGARTHKWSQAEEYFKDLHPVLESKLEEQVQQVLEFNPTVVGFSTYYTSENSVSWMAKRIKSISPKTKLIIGGPGMHLRTFNTFRADEKFILDGTFIFDYGVVGEAEQLILEILEEIEQGVVNSEPKVITQPENQRLNLSNFPIPDYKDFDFNKYQIPNGILTEFSRGCVAKCTFCEETHFWNYRQRNAVSAIEEIEHLYYNKGANVVWFLDSLVNGNLKELRGFCKGVVAKKLKLRWTGYARCDGRMDDEFFKDLADSGCFMLNYGCESGSDKVLEDIDKRVTKLEMEENFKLASKHGIENMTNWIVGFPTEKYNDFADTMTLLWRNKDNNITVIATAPGFGLGTQTIVGQNPKRFGLQNVFFLGTPLGTDFDYSKLHLLIRVKTFAMFCKFFDKHTTRPVAIPNRPNLFTKHTTLRFDDPEAAYFTPFEEFDYNIIKTDKGIFADSVMNELFVFFRMLWRMCGGYTINIKFSRELDREEFGGGLECPEVFDIDMNFKIDLEGNWEGDGYFKYVQPESYFDTVDPYPFKSYSFHNFDSNAAKRARKLSKQDKLFTDEDFNTAQALAEEYNKTLNLSFEHTWEGTGKWECDRGEKLIPRYKSLI
jgi:anaerobic magnesium-protoporphyrin IX monomethyl ester cyclase